MTKAMYATELGSRSSDIEMRSSKLDMVCALQLPGAATPLGACGKNSDITWVLEDRESLHDDCAAFSSWELCVATPTRYGDSDSRGRLDR